MITFASFALTLIAGCLIGVCLCWPWRSVAAELRRSRDYWCESSEFARREAKRLRAFIDNPHPLKSPMSYIESPIETFAPIVIEVSE